MTRSYTDFTQQHHHQQLSTFFPNHLPPAAYRDFNQQQQQQQEEEQLLIQQHSFQSLLQHEEIITSSSPAVTAFDSPPPSKYEAAVTEHHDGASIEQTAHRRPRGRPPGSKNKPKPPGQKLLQIKLQQPDPASQSSHYTFFPMTSRIFEVPSGVDIIQSLSTFANNRALCISVLSGAGAVAEVTLKQGSSSSPPQTGAIRIRGCFDILFLSATLFYRRRQYHCDGDDDNNVSSSAVSVLNASVSLSGPQGQIVGGILAGPLIASGTVYIIAGSFTSTNRHRVVSSAAEDAAAAALFETTEQQHFIAGGV